MITDKLYHRLRKFARGNIDFIEDFSLGHAEYPPPKWQSRADRFIVDFLRMARYRGDLARVKVRTFDKDLRRAVTRLSPDVL